MPSESGEKERYPADHEHRTTLALLSLDGLSVGDALGQRFFGPPAIVSGMIENRQIPPAPWYFTDDTAMAISIVETLSRHGRIHQDELALAFARRYRQEPDRGYGPFARKILANIDRGGSWRELAPQAFGGSGSMGNGGAMRVAPVGAYFYDDLDCAAEQAEASAEITHAHAEGRAGAVAIAAAAATAARAQAGGDAITPDHFFSEILSVTPPSATRDAIESARDLSPASPPELAAQKLGSGNRITAPDTVPFTLWCAVRHLASYPEAIWTTISGLGDRDTTSAIVGGIVALSAGRFSIPPTWLSSREPLPVIVPEN